MAVTDAGGEGGAAVQRCAGLGELLHYHASAAADDVVDGGDAVGGRRDFYVVPGAAA